jgi:hypothetical protein
MKPTGLRVAAFALAAVAVMDPSLTYSRATKPVVAVAATARHRVLADRVADELRRRFTVVRGTTDIASAAVLVGVLPDEARVPPGPTLAVVPQAIAPDVRIVRVEASPDTPLHSRMQIDVGVVVAGAAGRSVRVDVWAGDMMASRMITPVRADSGVTVVRLPFIPTEGSQVLRVIARLDDAGVSDTAHTLVETRNQRLRVLFFDGRPSWNSTFVRRTLERDSRFSVTHRIQTSRGLANTGGPAPASLRDFESLREFAVIVVGAPDLLTPADISGLESFMRRRGGRVVMMMETRPGTALDRLMGAAIWRTLQSAAPSTVTDSAGRTVLRARDIVWPASVPTEAHVQASIGGRDSISRPIVWSVPVGAGELTASGARDAWQYRGDSAGFDVFWLSTIVENAMRAPAPLDVQLSRWVVAPGDELNARVIVRDVFVAGQGSRTARVTAALVSDRDSTAVRLLPHQTPGAFTARVIAPRKGGSYRLVVEAGGDRDEAPFVVDSSAMPLRGDQRAVVEAFVSSRGGRVVEEPELKSLPDLVASAVQSVSRVETWHPMRSAWWIVPFALLLGVEWWWRRRRGLA